MGNGILFSKLSNEAQNKNRVILGNGRTVLYGDLSVVEDVWKFIER